MPASFHCIPEPPTAAVNPRLWFSIAARTAATFLPIRLSTSDTAAL